MYATFVIQPQERPRCSDAVGQTRRQEGTRRQVLRRGKQVQEVRQCSRCWYRPQPPHCRSQDFKEAVPEEDLYQAICQVRQLQPLDAHSLCRRRSRVQGLQGYQGRISCCWREEAGTHPVGPKDFEREVQEPPRSQERRQGQQPQVPLQEAAVLITQHI